MAEKPICSVEGCDNKVQARGWCNKHYLRWQKYGDVLYPVEAQVHGGSVLDRYWAKVDKRNDDECWTWKGYCARYGIFWGGEKRPNGDNIMVKAHRWTYEQFIGPIPTGIEVCHTCDNPPCVNPAHLFLGTHSDNMRDMVSKGRNAFPVALLTSKRHRGEANAAARLTADEVLQIRDMYPASGLSQQAIADAYGVNQTLVSSILARRVWKHI